VVLCILWYMILGNVLLL